MPVQRDLGVGLVGCGQWGGFILRDLVQLGCRTWVVARSPASVERARGHGAQAIVADLEALPRDLDGYVVAVPTTRHAAVTAALLERGAPIFVEKPFTSDPAELHDVAARGKGRVFVMHKWRYHPGVEALAELVRSRRLGAVLSIECRRLGWGSSQGDVDPIWVLAPHDLSIVLHLLGALPAPRWAHAERNGDGAVCGMRAQLGGDPAAFIPTAFIHVSSREPRQDRSVLVACEAGTALLADSYADHVAIRRGNGFEPGQGDTDSIAISTELPLLRELRCFIEHLAGGPPPNTDIAEEVALIETLLALRRMAGVEPPAQAKRRRA
jgi:predicted dehydrogenase